MSEHITDKVGEIIPEVYADGLKETTSETGKVLALIPRTVNAALAPLRQWIAQREYNVAETEKLLAEKLSKVSCDKIVTPEPYVAVPVLQAISYSMGSDELRELYANLLAKSMVIDTKDEVHPSFVEIVKQMSPLDAIVFKKIMQKEITPMIDIVMKNDQEHFRTILKDVTLIDINHIEMVSVSIDNLMKQGLIEVPYDEYYTNEAVYNEILNSSFYVDLREKNPDTSDGFKFGHKKRVINKTNLGVHFYKICVLDI